MGTPFRTGDNSWTMLENFSDSPAGFGIKIYSNIFLGEGTTFSGNNGLGASSPATYYVYNNTVIRKNGPDRTIGWINGGTLFMRNNIVMASTGQSGTDVDVAAMTPGTAGDDYNFWYQLAGTVTAGTTGPHGSNGISPQLVDYSNDNFALASGSPLIHAGDSTIGAEYNQGIALGATWPNPALVTRTAGAWDVGAYQSGGGSSGGNSAPNAPTSWSTMVR